jgi:hypothetical protein
LLRSHDGDEEEVIAVVVEVVTKLISDAESQIRHGVSRMLPVLAAELAARDSAAGRAGVEAVLTASQQLFRDRQQIRAAATVFFAEALRHKLLPVADLRPHVCTALAFLSAGVVPSFLGCAL